MKEMWDSQDSFLGIFHSIIHKIRVCDPPKRYKQYYSYNKCQRIISASSFKTFLVEAVREKKLGQFDSLEVSSSESN